MGTGRGGGQGSRYDPGATGYCGNSVPALSLTMKSAYHSGQFASSWPVLASHAPRVPQQLDPERRSESFADS